MQLMRPLFVPYDRVSRKRRTSGERVRARPQANLVSSVTDYGVRFWVAAGASGVGAGLGAVVMMAILHTVQHAGLRLSLRRALSGGRGQQRPASAGGVDPRQCARRDRLVCHAALPRRHGRRASAVGVDGPGPHVVARTAGTGVVQEVLIGLGGSLGREAAPHHVGAAFGSWMSNQLALPEEQRLLLIACSAGAGMGAVYNVRAAGAGRGLAGGLVGVGRPPGRSVRRRLHSGGRLGQRHPSRRLPAADPSAAGLWGLVSLAFPLLLGPGRDLAQFTFTGAGTLGTLLALARSSRLSRPCACAAAPAAAYSPPPSARGPR